MIIEEIHLEITRNCPIECEHCLRGDRQRVNMDPLILEELFKHIIYVDGILLTGGEPLLAIQTIEKLIEILKTGRVTVRQVRIITNGTVFGERIIRALTELSKYTIIRFLVSDNIFHHLEFERLNLSEKRNRNLSIMRNLDLPWVYREDYGKEEKCDDIKKSILKQGKAARLTQERLDEINAISPQKYVFSDHLYRHPYTTIDENGVKGNISIDVYGNLVNYGQTFEDEDKEARKTKLNIMKMPTEEAVRCFIKKHQQEMEEYYKDPIKFINNEKKLLLK